MKQSQVSQNVTQGNGFGCNNDSLSFEGCNHRSFSLIQQIIQSIQKYQDRVYLHTQPVCIYSHPRKGSQEHPVHKEYNAVASLTSVGDFSCISTVQALLIYQPTVKHDDFFGIKYRCGKLDKAYDETEGVKRDLKYFLN